MNICGGGSVSISEVIEAVQDAAGAKLQIDQRAPQPGDVRRTGGSSRVADELLGWKPETPIQSGIEVHTKWMREVLEV